MKNFKEIYNKEIEIEIESMMKYIIIKLENNFPSLDFVHVD